jgi:hypothetical protein
VRMATIDVDELAELVDVLDRMLERRLPAGKQRDGKEDPRETGEMHATWWELRRSAGRRCRWDRP